VPQAWYAGVHGLRLALAVIHCVDADDCKSGFLGIVMAQADELFAVLAMPAAMPE